MKIVVWNIGKHRITYTLLSLLLIATVLVSATIGIVINIYGEDLRLQTADAIPYEKIIILDAGHGGEDSGAVGVNGVLEKDLNLEITMEIGKALEEKGYVVVYTRTDDRLLYTEEENIKGIRKISDLKNRIKVAQRYPGALFVSIHMNSFGSSRYSGLQVYYSENGEESRALADSVQQMVVKDIQPNNKRVIKAGKDMFILENTDNPAILIECGFITNAEECKKLSEKEYKKELSFSIVCGIIDYIEKKSNQ